MIAARESAVNARLDSVATTLIASTAATTALLTLLGVNSERMWVLLDDNVAKWYLFFAGIAATVAILFGLAAYLVSHNPLEVGLLMAGSVCYVVGLGLALFAATNAADIKGRPSIVDMTVARQGETVTVSFQVTAVSVDNDERLGVRLLDADSGRVLTEAYPRAAAGNARLKVQMPLPPQVSGLILQAWSLRDNPHEPDCSLLREASGPDCLKISW